ncbi:MAG TPA: putative Ig domain-containing protein [Pseudonocardiaceae bacterium]|nr:putative Ig domain-containing protein [Pseudonocardiaceae bacterium]
MLTLAGIAALSLTFGSATAIANPATSAAATTSTATSSAPTVHACPTTVKPGKLACLALKRTDKKPLLASQVAIPNTIPSGVGYGPSQLQSAYNIASAAASQGGNATVALVDAYDDPSAASDLAAYRSAAGLPAANFSKVNQNGQTSPLPSEAPSTDDWTLEESLDIDMVSAICPNCKIVLVEAQDDQGTGLYTAENTAANLAGYISNSWGGTDSSSDSSLDTNFNHPGKVITASAGDSGYGVIYPATSRYVVSVGGTALNTASNSRGWTETVWGSSSGGEGTGSGCSNNETKPSWQTDTGCSGRTDNDISADADPSTGLAVYDTSNGNGGWTEVGGTSASSPMIAAMYALAGNAGSNPAQDIYQHTANLNDVTSGADGSCSPSYLCTAATGYDGPTGEGTPNGLAAFGGTSTGGGVTANNPGNQTGTVGTAVSLQLSASGGTAPYTWTASGLPAGLSISSGGAISGTPTTAGTFTVSATAKDSTGATGSTSFTWKINPSGGGGCTSPGQKLGNPGFESGNTVWSATPAVIGQNGPSEPAHSGSWDAWMDGYGTTHTDTVSQSVTIPAGCSASLSFYLHIDTSETTTTTAFDKLTVKVGSTTVATFSNLNHNSGYTQHTYNVSSLAGQTVTLNFTGTEDSSLQTSFVLDDLALTTS